MDANDNRWEGLSAYLDNELDPTGRADVEAMLDRDPAARRLLDELRRTAEWVGELPRERAPAGLSAEINARLERAALLDGAGAWGWRGVASATTHIRRMAMAAALLLAVGLGWRYWPAAQSPIKPTPNPPTPAIARQNTPALKESPVAKSDPSEDSPLAMIGHQRADRRIVLPPTPRPADAATTFGGPSMLSAQESTASYQFDDAAAAREPDRLTLLCDSPSTQRMLLRRLDTHLADAAGEPPPVPREPGAAPEGRVTDRRLVQLDAGEIEVVDDNEVVVLGTADALCDLVGALQSAPLANRARVELVSGDGRCLESWPSCADLASAADGPGRLAARPDARSVRRTTLVISVYMAAGPGGATRSPWSAAGGD